MTLPKNATIEKLHKDSAQVNREDAYFLPFPLIRCPPNKPLTFMPYNAKTTLFEKP